MVNPSFLSAYCVDVPCPTPNRFKYELYFRPVIADVLVPYLTTVPSWIATTPVFAGTTLAKIGLVSVARLVVAEMVRTSEDAPLNVTLVPAANFKFAPVLAPAVRVFKKKLSVPLFVY